MITLVTDYGPGTEHVGALHAVIASAAPSTRVLDLAHDIRPGDIRAGSVVLARTVALAPVGVHVAVVDPGVGTRRRALAVACADGRVFVGPDNGLMGAAVAASGAVAVVDIGSSRHGTSNTFDGRDLFAPVAARLATGGSLHAVGTPVDPASLVRLPEAFVAAGAGVLAADIVAVDRFGNVQLAAPGSALRQSGLTPGDPVWVETGEGARHHALVCTTFADVPSGGVGVIVDSHDHVAVSVNGASAEARLGPAARVRISRR